MAFGRCRTFVVSIREAVGRPASLRDKSSFSCPAEALSPMQVRCKSDVHLLFLQTTVRQSAEWNGRYKRSIRETDLKPENPDAVCLRSGGEVRETDYGNTQWNFAQDEGIGR